MFKKLPVQQVVLAKDWNKTDLLLIINCFEQTMSSKQLYENIHHYFTDNLEEVKRLVEEEKVSLETKYPQDNDKTPLIVAARDGKLGVTKYLIGQGAKIEATDRSGSTALICVAGMGDLDVVKYLVKEAKANVEAQNKRRLTPLIRAAEQDNVDVLKWLVTKGGAKVDPVDISGRSALHWAIANGSLEAVRCLVLDGKAYIHQDQYETAQWLVGHVKANKVNKFTKES